MASATSSINPRRSKTGRKPVGSKGRLDVDMKAQKILDILLVALALQINNPNDNIDVTGLIDKPILRWTTGVQILLNGFASELTRRVAADTQEDRWYPDKFRVEVSTVKVAHFQVTTTCTWISKDKPKARRTGTYIGRLQLSISKNPEVRKKDGPADEVAASFSSLNLSSSPSGRDTRSNSSHSSMQSIMDTSAGTSFNHW